MERFVPLLAFEHDTQPVIVVDEQRAVRFVNRAARRLLGMSAAMIPPPRCWLLAGFRAVDGSPFCGPDCPVRKAARSGSLGAQHWVVASGGLSDGRMIEMISFTVPKGGSERAAVLHFLRPVAATGTEIRDLDQTDCSQTVSPAHGLTHRETEVLTKLAEGLSTESIAERMRISTTTVRNHVQSILRKLGVHRRIEAVVAYGRGVAPVPEP